jgi:RecA-family ATPase
MGMEIGRDLLGDEKIERPFRVWYHNAEETLDELIRRTFAICKHFKIDRGRLEHFYVTNGFETPIKVAGGGRDVKIDTALRKEIIEIINELKIDVVIFDPLVAMHRVHEDFNSALDPVIRDVFGKIAHDTNCSIDLCHHTRKKPAGQDGEYTAADSRGGQSFVDAVRGLRVLNTMSKAEAANFDKREEDRFDYMKLSRGKANMVRRGVIGWYQFVPVELDNGVPEDGIPGDTVAVLDKWEPPKDSDLVRTRRMKTGCFWLARSSTANIATTPGPPTGSEFKIAERLAADTVPDL